MKEGMLPSHASRSSNWTFGEHTAFPDSRSGGMRVRDGARREEGWKGVGMYGEDWCKAEGGQGLERINCTLMVCFQDCYYDCIKSTTGLIFRPGHLSRPQHLRAHSVLALALRDIFHGLDQIVVYPLADYAIAFVIQMTSHEMPYPFRTCP